MRHLLGLVLLNAAFGAAIAGAQSGPQTEAVSPWEKPASRLHASTATVRITRRTVNSPTEPAARAKETAEETPTAEARVSVIVCSGVCVAERQLITAVLAGTDSQIRITLPGGGQAEGKLRAVDEFSGLSLIEIDKPGLTPLEISDDAPRVGAEVITASAWGVEKPVVSLGIVGGVERTLAGVTYPPLLQCDLRTTETSSGAGIVDRHGQLLGIIVATDRPDNQRGWAYAVPASHVRRLLRAAEKAQPGATPKAESNPDRNTPPRVDGAAPPESVLIIKRRRPLVGMMLEGEEGAIIVKRLTPGGPAEKAGIQLNDRIIAVNRVRIRSVYQAVAPTLYLQPGDSVTFLVARPGAAEQDVAVVLGGGVEVSSAPYEMMTQWLQPKIEIGRDSTRVYFAQKGARTLADVFAGAPAQGAAGKQAAPALSAENSALLEKALDRYRSVIEFQQEQIKLRDQERQRLEQQMNELQGELEAVRRQMEQGKSDK